MAGAWKVCTLGWLWAVLNTVPYAVFRSVTAKRNGGNLCYHNFALIIPSRAKLERYCEVRQAATAVSKLLLAFLIPLVLIAGSYVYMGLKLRSRDRRRKQSTTRLNDVFIMPNTDGVSEIPNTPLNTKAKISLKPPPLSPTTTSPTTLSPASQGQLSQSFIRMVTFVITAFALCWAPYHIFCIIELTAHYRRSNLGLVEVGLPLATTIAFLNPVLNPILYAFSCPHFCVRIRQSLSAVFEGLVEEDGGFLINQGKSIRAHMRRKSSRDILSPCKSPVVRPAFTQPPTLEDSGDQHMDQTGPGSNSEMDHS